MPKQLFDPVRNQLRPRNVFELPQRKAVKLSSILSVAISLPLLISCQTHSETSSTAPSQASTQTALVHPAGRQQAATTSAIPINEDMDSKTESRSIKSNTSAKDRRSIKDKIAALFNRQTELVEASLADVDPSDPNKIEWYFLGVAGYAGQNVFRSETNYARDLFDNTFHTHNHSIALINNNDSWDEQPIATKGTIEAALQDVGNKMGEEDVLFLSMSSHGKPNVFTLENYLIDIEDIDPVWLRQALDNAGIKWRVIVISSCFSGSFIDELMTPETAIITAAADDRTSFGCTNTAKMTYFGDAFYANSLKDSDSFEAAYNVAAKSIKARELADGFLPSNPQMAVGQAMKTQLPVFESVLFDTP